ncbi:MAG: hypothetical protein SGI77_19050 [Pirellulaceae bacterium]|nr:hypothetical protein [Pirellulaceae bacterium]
MTLPVLRKQVLVGLLTIRPLLVASFQPYVWWHSIAHGQILHVSNGAICDSLDWSHVLKFGAQSHVQHEHATEE